MQNKKVFIAVFILAIITGVIAIKFIQNKYPEMDQAVAVISTKPLVESKKETKAENTVSSTPDEIPRFPSTFFLSVPFTSQAPTANWDKLHNEACEEVSAIMVSEFINGNKSTTLEAPFVEQELSKITEWEKNHFGYYLDINSEEIVQIMQEHYGFKAKLITDFTEDHIKHELTQNHLIIWPANGKKLGNPNFRNSGPPYHVIVLKGYDSQGFITNDPGTRKGLNYVYTYETLYKANGNFDHETHTVDMTKKNAVVVWKE